MKANCSQVEMSSRKTPQRYLYTVCEESGIPSSRTICKKAKLDEVLAAHCRADLVTECMKKKTLILSGDFRFRFSAENECLFSFSFRFRLGRKWHFVYGRI